MYSLGLCVSRDRSILNVKRPSLLCMFRIIHLMCRTVFYDSGFLFSFLFYPIPNPQDPHLTLTSPPSVQVKIYLTRVKRVDIEWHGCCDSLSPLLHEILRVFKNLRYVMSISNGNDNNNYKSSLSPKRTQW